MKEKLTSNIGLKLLSLFLATFLWLAVINSQDPIETVTFTNIPVTIINEDVLTEKDKIPEIVEGDKITVVVEARRKICDNLTKDNIVAIADFEKVSLTDAVPIEVSVVGYADREVEIVRGMNQMMKLRLEDSISKDFRVKLSTVGEPESGYVIGDMVASPNMIRLTGSQTQINRIEEVVLLVNVDGMSKDSKLTGVPVIYDINGEAVNLSKVEMNAEIVEVKIPILQTKTVKVYVETVGKPAEGYEIKNISYQPQTVTIAGTARDLLHLGSAVRFYCDINGMSDTIEENVDISSLWNPSLESLRIVDEEELAVTIEFKEHNETSFEISKEDIAIKYVPIGMGVKIKSLTSDEVIVKGEEARLKRLTLKALAPYINLSGYTTSGTYTIKVEFQNMSDFVLKNEILAEIEVGVLMQSNDETTE